jgi:glycosyltransferase involved in cell wall biosynthesis
MKIAVNAGSLSKEYFNIFLILAKTYPRDNFQFIFNKETDSVFPKNVASTVIEQKTTGAIGQMRYAIKLAATLKKFDADVFISEEKISLKTKIPQLLISPDLSFIYHPSFFNRKQLDFYKKNIPLYLSKAAAIVVNSLFLKNAIIEKYKTNPEKIHVIYPGIKNDFTEIDFEERELVKEKYADGNEYFIYYGKIGLHQNLLNLLKAFSFFKKKQKSKMQVLICGEQGIQYQEFLESLRLFRFNKEVRILENLSVVEIQKILASSYAMVYVPFYETIVIPALHAMKCQVPLIVSSTGIFKEYFKESVLYADANNFKDVAEKMMLLFKNEHLRKELIEKGRLEIQQFFETKSEAQMLEVIKSIVNVPTEK